MANDRVRNMLGALGGGFKLNKSSQYTPVAEDEGRAMLEEEGIYNHDKVSPPEPKKRRSWALKVFIIGVAIAFLWFLAKVAYWAFGPDIVAPALEGIPVYGTALGCASAPHIYNNSAMTVKIPFDKENADHAFDVYGGIVGTFLLVEAPDALEIKYELTIRSDDPSLLDSVSFRYPEVDSDGKVQSSQFVIMSPGKRSGQSCLRYDIKMFVPPSLKKLHVAAHAVTHLTFDPQSKFSFDKLYVTLFSMSKNNLIIPHQSLHAKSLTLEVYRGWIVGDVSIVETTSINTQRGDGIASIRVHPVPSTGAESPKKAALLTATGAGRSDFTWVGPTSHKRPIEADHRSSMNGDVYLDYRNAHFSGLIALDSRIFEAKHVESLSSAKDDKWTHWAGDQKASDRLTVESRGWTGLYL